MGTMRVLLYFSWLTSLAVAIVHETKKGSLEGIALKSLGGTDYYGFLGVPYAKPPVGQLRFAGPVEFGEWTGVLKATTKGKVCTQGKPMLYNEPVTEIIGDEDCLTVNIYTRNPTRNDKVPVLVYIHGGAWREGGHIQPSQTKRIMDKDLVYVSVQYRLGPLGFFSTEDTVIPGNFGLKDQRMALKWVKENIADYGGNPDSITIHGESAGGASVHYQMKNSESQKLFHRAISESGTSTAVWSVSPPGLMLERTEEAGESMGCPPKPHTELLACLRKKSLKQIIESEKIFKVWDFDPPCTFRPTIEPKETPDAFVTEDPFEIKTSIPWVTGITTDEGAYKSQSVYHLPEKEIDRFRKQKDKILPHFLMYAESSTDPDRITPLVKERYFKDDDNIVREIQTAFSEAFFMWNVRWAINRHTGPVWTYLFDYRGNVSWTDVYTYPKPTPNFGVCHSDEQIYLFWMKEVYPPMHINDADEKMAKLVVETFANFVIHGDPSPNKSTPQWHQTTSSNEYLHISKNGLKMKSGLYDEPIKFWMSLPTLLGKYNKFPELIKSEL